MKLALISLFAFFAFVQDVPWTPFNDPDNRRQPERKSAFDVGHYRISLRIDDAIPPPPVEGRVEIDLALTAATGTVDLDAGHMTIHEVATADGKKLAFKHDAEKLAIDLGRPGAPGDQLKLSISYSARPTAGLFFVAPDALRPSKRWQVWSQGETEYNRFWFPCYDYPNDRATSEMIVTMREKYRSVSNGALVKTETKDGWRTDHWKMDFPHVAYLVSLAVGEFDVVEEGTGGAAGLPIRYFVPKGWHTEEEIRQTFARTPAMMKFFGERTGVPYPYPKYDQIVVDDFNWGGMENISATTLHPFTVVHKRSWADRDSDGLIAHELAHQWFGDFVTCRSWAHAWLNEGFATYMEALWQEKVGGREALVEDLRDGADSYLREAAERYTRPTACEHYTFPEDMFDSHIYPRGAWILHMLHTELGDELWWKGIRHYLQKHRAGLVSTDDFRIAMEEASGQKLKAFFDQWVWKAGHPAFKVTAVWDPASKTLRLETQQIQPARKLVWKDLETEIPIFHVSVDVEVETKAGRKTHRIDIKGKSHVFDIRLDSEPEIIDFDRDVAILKTLEFERTPTQLTVQLERDDQPWHRSWAATKLAGAPEGVAALGAALQKDPSSFVRIAAARALGGTATPEARAALLEKPQPDARVRKAVIDALASHAKDAAGELEKFFKDDASPACRAAAAAALGKRGGPTKAFEAWESHIADEVVMPGILAGMVESGDPGLISACLKAIERASHPVIRLRATEAMGDAFAKERDPSAAVAWRAFVSLFDDANFRVRRAAIRKAGSLDEKTAEELEKRIPKEAEKRLVKEIRESIRKIRSKKK